MVTIFMFGFNNILVIYARMLSPEIISVMSYVVGRNFYAAHCIVSLEKYLEYFAIKLWTWKWILFTKFVCFVECSSVLLINIFSTCLTQKNHLADEYCYLFSTFI